MFLTIGSLHIRSFKLCRFYSGFKNVQYAETQSGADSIVQRPFGERVADANARAFHSAVFYPAFDHFFLPVAILVKSVELLRGRLVCGERACWPELVGVPAWRGGSVRERCANSN